MILSKKCGGCKKGGKGSNFYLQGFNTMLKGEHYAQEDYDLYGLQWCFSY